MSFWIIKYVICAVVVVGRRMQSLVDPRDLRKAEQRTTEDIAEIVKVRLEFGSTTLSRQPSSVGKVAYMFMVKDGIDQEDLWRKFFEGASRKYDYSLYMHQYAPHTPEAVSARNTWIRFDANFIPQVRTGWGQLAGVMFALLWEAMRDPSNAQFVFASEGTVPLKSADYVYSYLMHRPGESKICFNTPENRFSATYNEAFRSCQYRDSLQAVQLPTRVSSRKRRGRVEQMTGRVRKHHQWLVLARAHAVDVLENSQAALLKHLDALRIAPLYKGFDPAMLGANDETFIATALLVASEKAGGAVADSMTELDRAGVKSECTTFVYWRHCWKGSALGADAGWEATKVQEVRAMYQGIRETAYANWTDPRKSPSKRLNDTPRDFGRTDAFGGNASRRKEYIRNMVEAGFLFARKFGRDERGSLSLDLSNYVPEMWKHFEDSKKPYDDAFFQTERHAWPVLDVGDDRVVQSVQSRVPKVVRSLFKKKKTK